ncbi:MAG: amino acid ABC transporter permease [Clostridia bacterium]|nr:amino acid ABC transporter permease [Clostridia bacterium]
MDIKAAWDGFINQMITNKGYTRVLTGLGNTLLIAVVGLAIGIFIGTLLAITKVVPQDKCPAKMFSKLTDIYVALFRGTPMVVQLLIMYYVLFPLIGLGDLSSVAVAIIAFGMNSGAYVCEIMRSGILSVDSGQTEAGRALGLNSSRTMMSIVLPQAVKNILPTLGNELISLIKETSVVSFIAVIDLTNAFRTIATGSYEYIIPYIVLALCYLVIVFIFTILIRLLERRLRASEKR